MEKIIFKHEDLIGEEDRALLEAVMHMTLKPEDKKNPFVPMYSLGDGRRSMIPKDLTGEQLERLSELMVEVEGDKTIARIADVLWVRRYEGSNCLKYRKIALEHYISFPINVDNWLPRGGAQMLARAVVLARALKDEVALSRISRKVLAALDDDANSKLICRLARFIYYNNLSDIDYLHIIQRVRVVLDESGDHIFAIEECHDLIAKLYRKLGEKNAAYDEIVTKAQQVVAWAKAQGDQLDSGIAQGRLEPVKDELYKLPKNYKEARGLKELIDEVDALLNGAYENGLKTMHHFKSEPIDLMPYIEKAREKVREMDVNHAMVFLLTSYNFSFAKLKEMDQHTILDFFPMRQVDEKGRPVAIDRAEDSNSGGGLSYFRRMNYMSQVEIAVKSGLKPIHEEMRAKYSLGPATFKDLSTRSKSVPLAIREVVAKGLFYGYSGDYETACYILIPQIECILRARFGEKEIVTRLKNADPTKEEEVSLSSLVKNCNKLYDEDLAFELQMLFDSPPYLNLRNDFVHGRMSECNNSVWAFYIWWFVLKRVYEGVFNAESPK